MIRHNRTMERKSNSNISFSVGTSTAVKNYSQKLNFKVIFKKYKKKGINIVRLLEALLSYKLSENVSIYRASLWINHPEVLEEFNIKSFNERTLYRVLEIIGDNSEEILYNLRNQLFSLYDFPHTDINLDWTSFVLWGQKAKLGAYGFSKDHRPDKKQVNVGIAELSTPINIPIGLTVTKGNVNDQTHFKSTFNQVKDSLKENSRITLDKGANSKENLDLILASKMKYLTAKKLNTSDDKLIKNFHLKSPELVDEEQGIYGIKIVYPSRIDYFYFSQKLYDEQIKAKQRKIEQKFFEAKKFQDILDKRKKLPKKYRVNNPLIDVRYSYQTKLKELGEKESPNLLRKSIINGREGFFFLVSKENLTLKEALKIYRMKDSIEKIFQSMKSHLNLKPLRVSSEKSIRGFILISYLVQLIISLIKYDYPKLKQTSPKLIKISLSNLTVTIERLKNGRKRRIFSNFDAINTLICYQNLVKT